MVRGRHVYTPSKRNPKKGCIFREPCMWAFRVLRSHFEISRRSRKKKNPLSNSNSAVRCAHGSFGQNLDPPPQPKKKNCKVARLFGARELRIAHMVQPKCPVYIPGTGPLRTGQGSGLARCKASRASRARPRGLATRKPEMRRWAPKREKGIPSFSAIGVQEGDLSRNGGCWVAQLQASAPAIESLQESAWGWGGGGQGTATCPSHRRPKWQRRSHRLCGIL